MKYIAANFKMHFSQNQVDAWWTEFSQLVKAKNLDTNKNVSFLLAPSHVHLPIFAKFVADSNFSNVYIVAQDVSLYDEGAHTGEVGAFQLKDFCTYAIVGHSERAEPTETVGKKTEQSLKSALTPLVCFKTPGDIKSLYSENALMVWEDPFAISQDGNYRDKNATAIVEGIAQVRAKIGPKSPLLYGGSVNRQNAPKLATISELDGVLIGHASLDPQHFVDIADSFAKSA